jgi:hypothetical protein
VSTRIRRRGISAARGLSQKGDLPSSGERPASLVQSRRRAQMAKWGKAVATARACQGLQRQRPQRPPLGETRDRPRLYLHSGRKRTAATRGPTSLGARSGYSGTEGRSNEKLSNEDAGCIRRQIAALENSLSLLPSNQRSQGPLR